jgi:protein-L-isoaspartate(D-aspartate) O-methyltransferase
MSKKIVDALEVIDRRDFVRPDFENDAYLDIPLPIGGNQTISQPTTVVFMLELLDLKDGNKVLDLGSGSGWTTALIASIVGKKGSVIGVELVDNLVSFGQNNLAKYCFKNAKIKKAGKTLGFPEEAPFDRILVSATSQSIPKELIGQLKVDGIMVVPVQNSIFKITKKQKGFETEEYPGFVFVPLINEKSDNE